MSDSFPPDGYIPAESTVSGIKIWMPRPPAEEHQEVIEFRCPQCSASKAFNTDDGGLTCSFCGYYEAPQAEVVGKGAAEFEFTVATMSRATQGWGEARKEIACQRCQAHVTISTEMLTHTCPFCHSNQVVQVKAPQDVLRPRFLIPFQIKSDGVRQRVAAWLGSSWLLPSDLIRLAHGTDFTPIYIPAWTFDAQSKADWKAEVAHTKTRTTGFGKNRRTRTVTEWRWESGQVQLDFDDVLVNGASNLSPVLLNQVSQFNLNELSSYDPAYLAGIQAQAYDISLDHAWEKARHTMRARTKSACQNQATSKRMRNFSMQLNFHEESWRYILLPLYIAVYHYDHKSFQILINGQSGQVSGQRPVAWRKVALAVAGAWLPALFVALVAALLLLNGRDASSLVFMLAFLLAAAAAIFAGVTLSRAAKMDDI